jgi:membrane-bound metal-dependent hydrolase YbcI (DUF457 family)
MNGKTHVATGVAGVFATTFLVVEFIPQDSFIAPPSELTSITDWSHLTGALVPLGVIFLIGVVAGQLPDIDQPTSTIANSGRAMGRMFEQKGFLGFILKVLFWIINFIPQGISWIANSFLDGHRGVVHSLLALIVVTGGSGFLSYLAVGTAFYGMLIGVAYLIHLLVDSFTKSGIGYLQPFSEHNFRLLPKPLCWKSSSPFWNALMQAASWAGTLYLVYLLTLDGIIRDPQVALLVTFGAILFGVLEFVGAWWSEVKKQSSRAVYSH